MKKYTILETLYSNLKNVPVHDIIHHNVHFASALFSLQRFKHWYVSRKLQEYNLSLSNFCCTDFALWNLEDLREKKENNPQPNPHRLIIYWEHAKSYGLSVPSKKWNIQLNYCPWCGAKLPEYQDPYNASKTTLVLSPIVYNVAPFK